MTMSVRENFLRVKKKVFSLVGEKRLEFSFSEQSYAVLFFACASLLTALCVLFNQIFLFYPAYVAYLLLYKPQYKALGLLGAAGAFLFYEFPFALMPLAVCLVFWGAETVLSRFYTPMARLSCFCALNVALNIVYCFFTSLTLYTFTLCVLSGVVMFVFTLLFEKGFYALLSFYTNTQCTFVQSLGLGVIFCALCIPFTALSWGHFTLAFTLCSFFFLFLLTGYKESSAVFFGICFSFLVAVTTENQAFVGFLPLCMLAGCAAYRYGVLCAGSVYIFMCAFMGYYLQGITQSSISLMDACLGVGSFLVFDSFFFAGACRKKQSLSSKRTLINDAVYGVVKDEVERTKNMLFLLSSHLSSSVDVSRENDVGQVCSMLMSDVCSHCNSFGRCWQSQGQMTYKHLFDMAEGYMQDPSVSFEHLASKVPMSCTKGHLMFKLISYICDGLKLKETYNANLAELRDVLKGQFENLAGVMDKVYSQIKGGIEIDRVLSESIQNALLQEGVQARKVMLINDFSGHERVYFSCDALYSATEMNTAVEPVLCETLGYPMLHHSTKPLENGGYEYCMLSKPKYHLGVGIKRLSKTAGEKNGDSFASASLPGAKQFVAICDGMGSGESAARQSTKVLDMLESVLKAGVSEQHAVDTVNAILMLGGENEVFTTLDALIFDEDTACASFVKSGACQSYIKRQNAITKIHSPSLPMGILKESVLKKTQMKLSPKDLIYMMSDGFLELIDGDEDWLFEKMRTMDMKSPSRIAQALFSEAVMQAQGEIPDDVSILVARVS